MRITRIKKLKKCGIFGNFEWDRELPIFDKFNLIYGQNGSGKTTLSRVLRDLELQQTPEYEALISTDGPNCIRGVDFCNAQVPIHVFNTEFVSENVFSVEGKNMPPIIVLGTKNKNKLDKLTRKKKELESAKKKHAADQSTKSKAAKSLSVHCESRARDIKKMLTGPDESIYRNYNKTKYQKRAQEILKENQALHRLDNQARKKLLSLHHTTPKQEIAEPRYLKHDLVALRGMVVDLLSRTVTAKAIQSLVDDPDKTEWILRGMDFNNNGECPFCKNVMPEQRKLDLEGHFNTEYKDSLALLDRLATYTQTVTESFLSHMKAPDCEIIHDSLHDRYREAKDGLDDYRDHVKKYLDSLATAISRKRHHLFEVISPDDILRIPDDDPPDNLCEIIREHNNICLNMASIVDNARERLERDYIAEDHEFMLLLDASLNADKMANESADRVAVLADEISKLERDIADHRRAAYDFNDDLSSYLGHGELRLDVREHGYAISRNGVANPLPSEGEKTAIALLYFLQSLKSDQLNIKESIVVLDDPISSLDTNALFAAVGFIRDHTKTAGQLFVLTHNFTFFREVRTWFKHRNRHNGQCDAQFYMLGNRPSVQNREAEIRVLDPLLSNYGSDYHYLFKCIWNGARSLDSLESNYHLPNMARRLLDSFLAFRQPGIIDLGGRLARVEYNEAKKRRIKTFVDAHSHNFIIAEPEHNIDLLGEAPNVLSDIMDLIKTVDPKHYNLMEDLVRKA